MISPKIVESHYEDHKKYWTQRRPELRRLRAAYMCRYWDKLHTPDQILIETSRAYEFIEGYVASLFARSPAIVAKGDLRGKGDPAKVQALVNNYLGGIRNQLEDSTRLGLIYPCSFLKLVPNDHPDPFKRVTVAAVAPWDVIVDTDAHSWRAQKFVGHRYHITVTEAKKKYGNKKFSGHPLIRFLERAAEMQDQGYREDQGNEDPRFQYVEVVEFYDFIDDRMVVWSPDYKNGEKFVYDGIILPEGAEGEIKEKKYNAIPFKDSAGHPIAPIVPLYYSRQPDVPMRGYSSLRRVYDQVQEHNIIRSYQASMVRRAARQWVVESGVFDAEAMAKLTQGVDGEFIEVELSPGQDLAGSIMAVPHTPVPTELQQYVQQVQQDFERGSVLAPFTRGESTRATATEITALAAYSSSEVGRLARERDSTIEAVAEIYISMMKLYLEEDGDVMVINGEPVIVTSNDLDGDFTFYAQDSGATPVSEAIKKQEFMAVMPTLMQMGVPLDKVLEEIVRYFDLPHSFLEHLESAPQMPQPGATTGPEAAMQSSVGMSGAPNPQDIQQFLPQ
tara:strand:- start:2341 stop:4020 length:1680 start_codon:yes stop_codon:yes gene_type:complete